MKRFITTITLFLVISSIWGIYVIPRTITVDSLTLSACQGKFNLYQFRKFKMYHFIQLC